LLFQIATILREIAQTTGIKTIVKASETSNKVGSIIIDRNSKDALITRCRLPTIKTVTIISNARTIRVDLAHLQQQALIKERDHKEILRVVINSGKHSVVDFKANEVKDTNATIQTTISNNATTNLTRYLDLQTHDTVEATAENRAIYFELETTEKCLMK
jgi:hypothetical protein